MSKGGALLTWSRKQTTSIKFEWTIKAQMGNKSRNHKRRQKKRADENPERLWERKKRLASLLDKAETSTIEQQIPIKDGLLDSDFSKILKKFDLPLHSNDHEEHEKAVVRQDLFKEQDEEDDNPEEQYKDTEDEENDIDGNSAKGLSKRQRKLANKPTMAELKAAASYPELVEWYDRDAEYPYFNAKIKTGHNVVTIPRNWQMKRGYLAGRSLLEQKPFELPEIIKLTDIEELRQTLPDGQEKDDDKLKDFTRAKVQPKLGTLDLDYKKLYDAFFKLRKNWKPQLLPFGDLYYENRNLENELRWKEMRSKYEPGIISPRLREALGLPEGMLPTWCKEMKEHGLPKSYPGIKVCGINWEISNLTNQTYASWPGNKSMKVDPKKFFGSLVSLEELDNSEEIEQLKYDSSESEEEEEVEEVEEKSIELLQEKEERTQVLESIDNDPTKQISQDANRPLYTVLREHGADHKDSQEYRRSYQISNKRRSDDLKEDVTKSKKAKIEEEEPDFRF